MTVRVARHPGGQTLYLSRLCGIPPSAAPLLKKTPEHGRKPQEIAGGFHRERKMRTNFFCTNFLSTPTSPGHPSKIPGTSQIPLFETQGRQTFEGGHENFLDPLRMRKPLGGELLRVRQRTGEGVVQRNSCPKGCFLESPFLLFPLKVFRCFSANFTGAEKKRTLQK